MAELLFKGKIKKRVPHRFLMVENAEDYLDHLESTRLSKTERKNLEFASLIPVWNENVRSFTDNLKKKEPYVYELISGKTLTSVVWVQKRYGSGYAICIFGDKTAVRCPDYIYNNCPYPKMKSIRKEQ